MIVADTNLVAYLLVEGERTAAARAVWERDPEWRLPTLWRSEWLNVLASMIRIEALTEDEARQVWFRATALFGRDEREPEGEKVLAAAVRYGLSAYDAQFVALAEEMGLALITGDREILTACPEIARSIEDFAGGRF